MRRLRLFLLFSVLLLVSACGNKGELTLPSATAQVSPASAGGSELREIKEIREISE